MQQECLSYALNIREQHGIWGGLTENERRDLLNRDTLPVTAFVGDRGSMTGP